MGHQESRATEPQPPSDFTTPGNDAKPATRPSYPKRGRRKRILDKDGDYVIMAVAPSGKAIPGGSFIPIPETPRFASTAKARNWILKESGDLLGGKQVVVVRVMRIMKIDLVTKPGVQITEKPPAYVVEPEYA